MDWTSLLPLAVPATIIAAAAVAHVAGSLSAQAEAKQQSRVSRIEAAVSRVAGGVSSELLAAMQAGHTGDVLQAIKAAAIDQGAAYLQTAMPATLAAAGATTPILTAMISGELGKQSIPAIAAALAPQLAGVAATALGEAAVQKTAGSAPAAADPAPVAPTAEPAQG